MSIAASLLALALSAGQGQEMTFSQARALIERVEIAARECDWALKVTKVLTDCDTFYELSLGDHRQLDDAFPAVRAYANRADDRDFRAIAQINAITAKIEEINAVSNLLAIFIEEGRYVIPDAR